MVKVALRYMDSPKCFRFNLKPYAHPLTLLSRLYMFGDKFLVIRLTDLAGNKLIEELSKDSWACEDLLRAVQCLYAMTGRRTVGLRKVFLSKARKRLDELVNEPLFLEIVRNVPEFTACLGNVVRGRTRRRPQQRSSTRGRRQRRPKVKRRQRKTLA